MDIDKSMYAPLTFNHSITDVSQKIKAMKKPIKCTLLPELLLTIIVLQSDDMYVK